MYLVSVRRYYHLTLSVPDMFGEVTYTQNILDAHTTDRDSESDLKSDLINILGLASRQFLCFEVVNRIACRVN